MYVVELVVVRTTVAVITSRLAADVPPTNRRVDGCTDGLTSPPSWRADFLSGDAVELPREPDIGVERKICIFVTIVWCSTPTA